MIARFLSYWARYATLSDHHREWLEAYATPLSTIPQGWPLHDEGARTDYLFFVLEGLLAAVSWDEAGRRRIHLLAPPLHNLMATQHFYTDKRVPYQVVALRPSAVVRLPVKALKQLRDTDPVAVELVSVLREKQLKQYLLHNALLQIQREGDRYRTFGRYFKDWMNVLTLQEQADYLNMSLSSVNRARRGDI